VRYSAILSLLLVSFPLQNITAQTTFSDEIIVSGQTLGAIYVFSADLDGDGDEDMLSASEYDNKIAWYENKDGLGTFGLQRVITTDISGARSVYSIDLDGDGDNDVLSASKNDDKIAWYENMDGLGTFGPQQIITTSPDGVESVYSSDLDGDGDNDVLSAAAIDSKIAWYENTDGLGTFGPEQVITTRTVAARSVYSIDLDGDGDNDVLSASDFDNKIAWYENMDGLGTFGTQQVISTDALAAQSVYSIDIDGDGDNDVLSAAAFTPGVAWYENTDGLGTFGPQQVITTNTASARSVYSTDLDGDGDNDVLSASHSDNKIAWYENTDGLGTFGPQQIITTSAKGARSVYSTDLDGDGDDDVLSASHTDDKIAWYENTDGLGSFGPQKLLTSSAKGALSAYSTDLDGDGDNDMLSASYNDDKIAWYENTDGQGTFGPQQIITTNAIGSCSIFSTDLDGDGDNDVLSASFEDNKIAWYENTDGQGTFGSQQVITTSTSGAAFVYSIDLDGDGDNDVLSASEDDDKIAWYENTDGLGTFGLQQIITASANGASSVFSADLDGDGDNDVLSSSYSDDKIAWYENMDGQGTFGPQQIITTSTNAARSVFGADLDGDGDTDVLSASFSDDKIAWYENTDGLGSFGPQQIITTSTDGARSVYSTDVDGDGDNDVLSASLSDDKIAWYENTDGQGTFGPQQVIATGAEGANSVYSADLDGDGDNDVLSASTDDDKIAWYRNETPHPLINIELTYQSGSPVPPDGGNLIYDIFVENNDPNPVEFDGWIESAYEGGNPETLVFRSFTDYQPGWIINRPNTIYPVPGGWAAGNYTMAGKVGIHPDIAWDASSFPFIKEGTNYDTNFVPFPVADAPNPFEIINEEAVEPSDYDLLTIHPNPFNPTTVICFELRIASYVKLSVFDIAGRNVNKDQQKTTNDFYQSGHHSIIFDGSDLPSGVYFARLKTGGLIQTKKMVLIK